MKNRRNRKATKRKAVVRAERSPWTPETMAKLPRDTIADLIRDGHLPENAKGLAEDLVEAYGLRTAGMGYGTPGVHGQTPDSIRSEALQIAWCAWAKSIFALTLIRPHVFVEWSTGERVLDRAGASVFQRGLTYWSRDLAAAWKQVQPERQQAA